MPSLSEVVQVLPGVLQLSNLFALGGPVLVVLTVLALLLWTLLLGKLWFSWRQFPSMYKDCHQAASTGEFRLRSHCAQMALAQSSALIRTVISVCPLLGLAGTVLGMIEIFDVIAISDRVDAQQLAGGVARAIIPTMAAMVIAISAIMCFGYLQRWSTKQRVRLRALGQHYG